MFYPKSFRSVPSILAVDDDQDNLHLISYVVEALNLKCYGVNDSTEVLDLAIDKAPKVILLDIVMPEVSGFEIIRQLKSNLFTANIPIIAVTGLASLYHQAIIRSAEFDDYICKPFALEELEEKLIKCLNICQVEVAA